MRTSIASQRTPWPLCIHLIHVSCITARLPLHSRRVATAVRLQRPWRGLKRPRVRFFRDFPEGVNTGRANYKTGWAAGHATVAVPSTYQHEPRSATSASVRVSLAYLGAGRILIHTCTGSLRGHNVATNGLYPASSPQNLSAPYEILHMNLLQQLKAFDLFKAACGRVRSCRTARTATSTVLQTSNVTAKESIWTWKAQQVMFS